MRSLEPTATIWEIIAYAQKYREKERYLDAEQKYKFAIEYKKNTATDLEFADFYREVRKFEKSISAYKQIIEEHRRSVQARNGMGKTYLDWARMIIQN